MPRPARRLEPDALAADLRACREADAAAIERVCAALRGPVAIEAARMLGDHHPEQEDTTQETVLAALGYLRRDTAFQGDLVKLAVTIARNRCRDLLRRQRTRPQTDIAPLAEWIADPRASALDELVEQDRRRRLQRALDRLDQACRDLLQALYVEGKTAESVRRQLGLGTVQAVYHRRAVCLRQVRILLQKGLVRVQDMGTTIQTTADDDAAGKRGPR